MEQVDIQSITSGKPMGNLKLYAEHYNGLLSNPDEVVTDTRIRHMVGMINNISDNSLKDIKVMLQEMNEAVSNCFGFTLKETQKVRDHYDFIGAFVTDISDIHARLIADFMPEKEAGQPSLHLPQDQNLDAHREAAEKLIYDCLEMLESKVSSSDMEAYIKQNIKFDEERSGEAAYFDKYGINLVSRGDCEKSKNAKFLTDEAPLIEL